jgi:hypothetical protein
MARRSKFGVSVAVAVMTGLLGLVTAGASERGSVPPDTWASAVCKAARPAATRAADEFESAGNFPTNPPGSTEELEARVRSMDRLVAAMSDVLSAIRDGMAEAGIPTITDGRHVVRAMIRALDRLVDGLGTVRAAFAHYLDAGHSDRERAGEQVRRAIAKNLSRQAFRRAVARWPARLGRAMKRSSVCRAATAVLEQETAAL